MMKITYKGITAAAICLLMFWLAYIFAARELYIVAFTLFFVLVFSVLSSVLGAFTLKFNSLFTENTVIRRDNARIELSSNGFTVLPVCVRVDLYTPILSVDSGQKQNRYKECTYSTWSGFGSLKFKEEFEIMCRHTGIYVYTPVEVHIRDIFGFVAVRPKVFNRRAKTLMVYPNVYGFKSDSSVSASDLGASEVKNNSAQSGENFSGTRKYIYGDRMKRVHWKQTIKTKKVYVREYESESSPSALVILNPTSSAADVLKYGDVAGEVTASIVKKYIDDGCSIKVAIPGMKRCDLYTVSPNEDLRVVFDALAAIGYTGSREALGNASLRSVDIRSAKNIYVVSNSIDSVLYNHLKECRLNGSRVVLISPLVEYLKSEKDSLLPLFTVNELEPSECWEDIL